MTKNEFYEVVMENYRPAEKLIAWFQRTNSTGSRGRHS